MPIKKSAKKALRQSKKRAERNKKVKDNITYLLRQSRKAIEAKTPDKAKEFVKKAIKALDKAVQKKIMKKNTVARTKSRLMKKLNTFLKEKK